MVVQEERSGLKRPLGHTAKGGPIGSCMCFEGAIVESPRDPIVHKLRDDIALQRMLEKPGQELKRHSFNVGVGASTTVE